MTGVALQLQQSRLSATPVYAAAARRLPQLLLASLWLATGRARRAPAMQASRVCAMPMAHWCMGWALLAWAWTGAQALQQQAQQLTPAWEGRDVRVQAVVDAMPQRTATGWRLRLQVEKAWDAAQPQAAAALPHTVEVMWYDPRPSQATEAAPADAPVETQAGGTVARSRMPAPVQAGQRWEMTVRLKAPHGTRNPQGFDWELWLWEQGVGATGYVRAGRGIAPPQLRDGHRWPRAMQAARQHVRDAIMARAGESDAQALPQRERALGVVAALVTGDQRAIDAQDWDVFRRTGTAHLVSLSGLHITMFAWLAMTVVGGLWRSSARLGGAWCMRWPAPTVALWAGVGLAALYAWFSGWGLPAQRTVWMLAVVALLRSGGWRWPWQVVWAVALAVLALADPWGLCQPGFWLSFVAVGVLLASGRAPHGEADALPISAAQRVRTWLARLLREQLVVVAALSPLTLLFFGQISVVGLLANALAIPWVTLLLTPIALLGVVWQGLWEVAVWLVYAMTEVLQVMAHWPGASVLRPQAPWWGAAAAIAGGVWLAQRIPWSWRMLALPMIWPALWWPAPRPPHGELQVLALDVGQGSAILLRTAHHSLLFDAGPGWAGADAGARVVQPLLQAWGEALDVLVLSHGDADHIGGASSIWSAQPQVRLLGDGARVWHSRMQDAPQTGNSVPAGAPLPSWQPCVAGQQWEWDGVLWQVLHPMPQPSTKEADAQAQVKALRPRIAADSSLAAEPALRHNTRSCVLRVQTAKGAAVLLPGDIEAAQEAALLRSSQVLQADLLLAPHHGSRTSSSPAWAQAVAPRTVVVQAGYRNRFGHPHASVVQRYVQQGAQVVTTAQCGAVHWDSRNPQQVQCERMRQPRYWAWADR